MCPTNENVAPHKSSSSAAFDSWRFVRLIAVVGVLPYLIAVVGVLPYLIASVLPYLIAVVDVFPTL